MMFVVRLLCCTYVLALAGCAGKLGLVVEPFTQPQAVKAFDQLLAKPSSSAKRFSFAPYYSSTEGKVWSSIYPCAGSKSFGTAITTLILKPSDDGVTGVWEYTGDCIPKLSYQVVGRYNDKYLLL